MKYSLLITLFSISGILTAQNPSYKEDNFFDVVEIYPMTNGVMFMKVENFEVKEDSSFLRGFRSTQQHIYSKGKIEKVNFLYPKTDSVFVSYNYDSLSRRTSKQIFEKEQMFPLIQYLYDDSLRTASKITYNKDSTVHLKTVVKYNVNYMPILEEEFKQDSILTRYWVYKYDSCEQLIEKIYINTPNGPGIAAFGDNLEPWPNDTTKYRISYFNNCKPKQILEFSNSNLDARTTFFFSGDTAVTKREEFNFQNEIDKLKLTKIIDSIKIEKIFRLRSSQKDNSESIYHSDVLVEDLATYYGTKTITKYKYQYTFDEKGNWVLKEFFENGKLVKLIKRTIEYQNAS